MPKPIKYLLLAIPAVLVLAILVLGFMDWNAFKDPLARMISRSTGKTVTIGHLQVRLLSLTPSAVVEGLKVGNPDWAGPGSLAEIDRLAANVKLLPLLVGNFIVPRLTVDRPVLNLLRDAEGRGSWESPATTPRERSEPAELPAIQRFVLNDGQIKFIDRKRKLELEATVVAAEEANKPAERPFRLDGQGTVNGEPFEVKARGGPLIDIDQNTPYSFDGEIRAGQTQVKVGGTLPEPFDLGEFEATLDFSGADLADLYYLTELALPNTAPYRLKSKVTRNGKRFRFDDLSGTVGDSDMRGALAVDIRDGRPKVTGELISKRLDLDDLAASLGAPPSIKEGETASEEQKKTAAKLAAEQRIFPDAKLDVTRVKAMDAAVSFRAEAFNTPQVPLRKVIVNIGLEQGVLTLKPISFEMPHGVISADVRLDSNPKVPDTDIDLRLSKLRLEEFLKKTDGPPALQGSLQGRAQIHGSGDSVRQVASTANGSVTVVVPEGEIRQAFAELTGVNVAKGIGLLLKKDKEKTTVRCGVAGFKVTDGQLVAESIVVDTDDVLITGSGGIDLDEEKLALDIKGEPKKPRLLRLRTPIELRGTLRKPAIGVKAEKLAGQASAAAALGALLTPIAALLAFVDPGLAEDANCGALLAQAKEKGVSVQPTTP